MHQKNHNEDIFIYLIFVLMKKKQLTLEDLRKAIYDLNYPELSRDVERMSDEAFLECQLEEDLGLDSMDVVELTVNLENNCDICLPCNIEHDIERNGNTVQICLNTCNNLLF